MGGKEEEFRPADRTIHLKCQLQLNQDVALIVIARYNDNPEKISLKKGTNLTLISDQLLFCATDQGCESGPLVRIDETREIEVERMYIGRSVVIPARFLILHPNVL